jgi:hypothetical protein
LKQRTTATAIAALSNNLGTAVGTLFVVFLDQLIIFYSGFVIGPYIVEGTSMAWFLVIEALFSVVVAIWAVIYLPPYPPTPPSSSAEASRIGQAPKFWRELLLSFKNPHLLLVAAIGGIVNGTFNGWSGMFDELLSPHNYSENLSGWIGFGCVLSCKKNFFFFCYFIFFTLKNFFFYFHHFFFLIFFFSHGRRIFGGIFRRHPL